MDCDSGESHLPVQGAVSAEGARYTKGIFNLSGKRTENFIWMHVRGHVLFRFQNPRVTKARGYFIASKVCSRSQKFLLFFRNTPTVYANCVEDKKPEKKGKIENVGSTE